ncbi:hypothetical protein WICPIJ_003058 [Wickerhamomyces pijperi]|uniref:Uncharacterized protein n=1 Tax=Wickerhamomyces pijperi TaxID=599730 RepID=A0A9P8QAA6_WICPI|nr:hypothetical protein WICPIJ_003058 [Wickerhamomyces pijperi]
MIRVGLTESSERKDFSLSVSLKSIGTKREDIESSCITPSTKVQDPNTIFRAFFKLVDESLYNNVNTSNSYKTPTVDNGQFWLGQGPKGSSRGCCFVFEKLLESREDMRKIRVCYVCV